MRVQEVDHENVQILLTLKLVRVTSLGALSVNGLERWSEGKVILLQM